MRRNSVGLWVFLLGAVAASGYLYSWLVYRQGYFLGAVFALSICVPILAFERGLIFPKLRAWINTLPTAGFLVAALIADYVLISIGNAVCGITLWSFGWIDGPFWRAATLSPQVLLYTLAVLTVMIFILRVRDLLGRDFLPAF